jgi:hypothetical protein
MELAAAHGESGEGVKSMRPEIKQELEEYDQAMGEMMKELKDRHDRLHEHMTPEEEVELEAMEEADLEEAQARRTA